MLVSRVRYGTQVGYVLFPDESDNEHQVKNRLKLWRPNPLCTRRYVRNICSIGLYDLRWVIARPELFVNKIRLELDPLAFRCLELWYTDRVRPMTLRRNPMPVGYEFNAATYVPKLSAN